MKWVTTPMPSSFVPIDIAAGGHHVCAMTQPHTVKCWGKLIHSLYIQYHSVLYQFAGRNDGGQLGMGCEWNEQFGDSLASLDFGPAFIPEIMQFGLQYSCFVSTIGSMVCFGKNNYGQVYLIASHFHFI